ncbi:ATPase [Desulfosarcina ovata subsp. sediminis]|uniref:ATPase n=1 Tax=Desulfosarcina ovata subsp. sediminis TaxID=885957 RepID=A0A5K7ZYV7_9BACT|nr:ATP-binding protein [Desulfosarcina ovata]BBO85453.1 ATPase [Desulfosarcina ovata subsp. sediminis]
MQGMIPRWITNEIKKKIAQVPAVALLGARQVGKTTLAKTIAKGLDSVYLDLEAPEDLLKLRDPAIFLRGHSDKLVILDEIQRAPDLFPVLRGLIDKNREQGRKSGQFLFLGSASMDLMRQTSESLAGRISYIYMGGLNVIETGHQSQTIHKLWVRGGFPESYLAADDNIAMDWLEDLIRTYLERDLPQLGYRVPAIRMRRLWTMLAHLQGEPVNYSKLGANLEIDGKTVSNYIDILSDLLLVRRLEPWHANVKKRLIKSPRYYIRDSGILHRLLGIDQYDALLSNPVLGKSWEGFVVENIHSVLPRRAETYFYRTAAGAEIDLVIRMPSSEIWAVEIKYGTAPKLGRHYSAICDDIGATRKYIIYGGDDEFSVGSGVTVISLPRFVQELGSC